MAAYSLKTNCLLLHFSLQNSISQSFSLTLSYLCFNYTYNNVVLFNICCCCTVSFSVVLIIFIVHCHAPLNSRDWKKIIIIIYCDVFVLRESEK